MTVTSHSSGGALEAPRDGLGPRSSLRPRDDDSAALRIRLLGGFQVTVGTRVIDESEWYLRKAKHLVKLLAGSADRRLHRGELIDNLWPELDTDAGTNNLHKVLHIARRVLEPDLPAKTPSAFLHMQGEFVLLSSGESVWIDAEAFSLAAGRAQASGRIDAYEEAIALYRGDLLPEDRYDDWAMRRRDALRAVQFRLLVDIAALYESQGDSIRAIAALKRVVESEPTHEEAQIQLIQLLAVSGQRQLALRQYRQLRDALLEELQIEPSNTARKIYEEVLASEPVAGTRILAASPQLAGIESGRDPVIGRDAELAQLDKEVTHLFEGRGNLVVLTGDVGLGKSRLITEAAERATKAGAMTLWGAAYRSRKSQPYHLVSVLLDGFALRIPPENLRALVGASGKILASLAPNLARSLEVETTDNSAIADSSMIASAMLDFLAQLTRFAPVTVVLENLHLADEESVRLIENLAGFLNGMPVLMLTAYRESEVTPGSALDRLRESITENETATVLDLAAISVSDTERLAARVLGGIVDTSVVEAIYRVAAGNLHYTREAIEALQGRKRIVQNFGTWQLRSGIAVAWDRNQLRGRPESGDFQLVRRLRA